MSLLAQLRVFAGFLSQSPHDFSRNVLIFAAVLGSTGIAWSIWSPVLRRRAQNDLLDDAEAIDEGDGRSCAKPDKVRNTVACISNPNCPPPAADGLEVLHEDEIADVDFVAVHGLGAHPAYAWVWLPQNNGKGMKGPEKAFNWLKELLKTELRCRVMAFNYNSSWISHAPQQRLSSISDSLMRSIQREREKTKTTQRPIIFIGHSFGGTIIKQAILTALRDFEGCQDVAKSTAGLLFLGTPHRGTPQAAIAAHIAHFASIFRETEVRLLNALKPDDDALIDRLKDFSRWLFVESVPVVCVFEKHKTDYVSKQLPYLENLFGNFGKLVVPETSACIDGHDRIGLDSDHLKLNKYYGPEDSSFRKVYSKIKQLADEAESVLVRRRYPQKRPENDGATSGALRKCLQKMSVSEPVHILSRIINFKGKRVGTTCTWILNRTEFCSWMSDSDSQLLRLMGPPGTGKTMLSTFLVQAIQERTEKSANASFAYFFFDDKDQDRKTPTAFLRSIIWQMIVQKNHLFCHIQSLLERHEDDAVFKNMFDDYPALYQILESMIKDRNAGEVFILADALDECEEATRKHLITLIEDLFLPLSTDRIGKLKFLLTCRPGIKDIDEQLRNVGTPLVINEDNVNADLEEYIHECVENLARRKRYSPDLKGYVLSTLSNAAQGTFLWISLMIEELRRLSKNSEVAQKLKNLPIGLDEIYERILRDIESRNEQARAEFLLSIMVAAHRPLKRIEIAAAFAFKDGKLLTREYLQDYLDICSCCSSIVNVDGEEDDYDSALSFCHQSVKDFLVRKVSTSDRKWYHKPAEESHLHMFKICWKYFSIDEFDNGNLVMIRDEDGLLQRNDVMLESLCPQYPFLDYSARCFGFHAAESRGEFLSSCDDQAIDIRRKPMLRDFCLIQTAARGTDDVVRMLLDNGADIDAKIYFGHSALFSASFMGHKSTVQLLLDRGADFRDKEPLFWAALKGHEAIVEIFLQTGADIEAKDDTESTLLSLASSKGHKAVVQLLLQNGANVEATENKFTPLVLASIQGHETVVKLLLQNGADMETKDTLGNPLLSLVSIKGHKAVVQLLLQNGADIEAKDGTESTPLTLASKQGHKAVVQLLLQNGADIETKDNTESTPLSLASRRGHGDVVQILLQNGADIETKDHTESTPLSWASYYGHTAIAQLFLLHGADIETRDNTKSTPLSWASCKGHTAIAQLLLLYGADIEAKDQSGLTPLAIACMEGEKALVQLLLEKGADIEAQDILGFTPLLEASFAGHDAVVHLLCERGANVKAKDKFGYTPLLRSFFQGHKDVVCTLLRNNAQNDATGNNSLTPQCSDAADWSQAVARVQLIFEEEADGEHETQTPAPRWRTAANGFKTVVSLLLEKRADVDGKDVDGETPLWIAAADGCENLVKILLEKGAKIEAKDHHGQTPLWVAAANNMEGLISILLKKGADIESRDNHGQTPLWIAAAAGAWNAAETLLEHGAIVDTKDNGGRTPLEQATHNKDDDMVQLLQRKFPIQEKKDTSSTSS